MNNHVNKRLDDLLAGVGCDANPRTPMGVVEWLYETHGIWICVGIVPFEKTPMFEFSISNVVEAIYMKDGVFDTPLEAYEAAIEYSLTIL